MKEFIKENLLDYIMITIGAICASVSLELFLIPNNIIDGGITGASIMLATVTPYKVGMYILLINIPFLIVGYKQLGKDFLIKSTYGMILFSLSLNYFGKCYQITNDTLLATAFGGMLLGISVGFVIRYGGCLDGTEVIAILLNKRTSLSGILFGVERAMYSLLTYFITFKLIDIVEQGLEQAKAVMIITNHGEDISDEIYNKLGRTVTILEGEGLISGKKVVLYSVITRLEVFELKRIVHQADVSAFVTISDVSEILGKHIKQKIKK